MLAIRWARSALTITAVAAIPLLTAACSDDGDDNGSGGNGNNHGSHNGGHPTDLAPVCQAIHDACMPKDPGTQGMVNDCHVKSMENDTGQCQELTDMGCIEECEAAPVPGGDAGTEHDGG